VAGLERRELSRHYLVPPGSRALLEAVRGRLEPGGEFSTSRPRDEAFCRLHCVERPFVLKKVSEQGSSARDRGRWIP
jgi:hypothetical protein